MFLISDNPLSQERAVWKDSLTAHLVPWWPPPLIHPAAHCLTPDTVDSWRCRECARAFKDFTVLGGANTPKLGEVLSDLTPQWDASLPGDRSRWRALLLENYDGGLRRTGSAQVCCTREQKSLSRLKRALGLFGFCCLFLIFFLKNSILTKNWFSQSSEAYL